MVKKVLSLTLLAFRWTVRFVEKWIKNVALQASWIVRQSKVAYHWILSQHTTSPHGALKFMYGLTIMIMAIPVFGALVLLSFLKSI